MSLKIHLALLALVLLFGNGVAAFPIGPACCGSEIGTPYPDGSTCVANCFSDCYLCNFSEFGYNCEGYYGYQFTCQQTDKDSPEPKLSVDAESTCDGLLVTVTSGGDPVRDARTVAKVKTPTGAVELLGSGDTNGDGEILFPGLCGDEDVNVYASESGYKASDTLVIDLIPCAQCGEEGCRDDSGCPADQKCSNGDCVPVPCECGQVVNRECVKYACCSDAECPDGKSCREHVCEQTEGGAPGPEFECTVDADCGAEDYCALAVGAAGGNCEPVTGDCGYVENHKYVPYECGDDETCPACPQGETCTNNVCIRYELNCPTTGAAGQEVVCTVLTDGQPCVNCQVDVTGPDGSTSSLMTDEDGNVVLPGSVPGTYTVLLPKNGQQLNVQVGSPVAGGGEEEEPPDGGPFSWLLLLLLLVLLGAGVWWLSAKKK